MKEKILSLGRFLKKNVYYVLLIACVLAVGTMITLTIVQNGENNDVVIEVPDEPADENQQTPPPDDQTPGDQTPGDENNPSTDVVVDPIVFCEPVSGSVIGEFAVNELVYCSTLKQWQTHSGIDYSCEAGASVVSVYDGVVYAVSYDLLHGNVVTVDHGNGLMTKYGALDSVTVKEGDKVSQGTEIGKAGNTAMAEVATGTHLHFETLLDGASVNPIQYSPNK